MTRPELRERFLAIVQRGIERAAREYAEHLASLRPTREDQRRRGRPRLAEQRRPQRGRVIAGLVFFLLVFLPLAVSAQEAKCVTPPEGGTCICSMPLNQATAGLYTEGPTDFWRATNQDSGTECSQDGTGHGITRTSGIVGSNDSTMLAALPAGHNVQTAMRPQDNDHQGTFYTGTNAGVSSSFARVAARFYRYFSPDFEFSGEGAGGCFNSKFIQSDRWNSDMDEGGNVHYINTPGQFTPDTDCCTSGSNGITYSTARGKWLRFETVIWNRNSAPYDTITYGKNITDDTAEVEIIHLSENPESAGAPPTNLTPISLSSTIMVNGHRSATTSCAGFTGLSHFVYIGWTTNAGQRIGAATEVEGEGTPPAAFGMTSPWIRFIGLVGVLVALIAVRARAMA